MLICPTFSISVFSSALENNTVLQQALKSLNAHEKPSDTSVAAPQITTPSVSQEIKGTSTVKDVWFTWLIISSDRDICKPKICW